MKQGFFPVQILLISVDAQACKCKYYMRHTSTIMLHGKARNWTAWALSVQVLGAEATTKTATRTSETEFVNLTMINIFSQAWVFHSCTITVSKEALKQAGARQHLCRKKDLTVRLHTTKSPGQWLFWPCLETAVNGYHYPGDRRITGLVSTSVNFAFSFVSKETV